MYDLVVRDWRESEAEEVIVAHLVAETLRGNDGDFIADALVGLEVESELWVVPLDDHFRGLFDGLVQVSILG